MNPSELKYLYEQNEQNGGHFFTRSTMKWHGDTMRNYGVCKVTARWKYPQIHDNDTAPFEAYELYRRKPVKHGVQSSAFFSLEGEHLTAIEIVEES